MALILLEQISIPYIHIPPIYTYIYIHTYLTLKNIGNPIEINAADY